MNLLTKPSQAHDAGTTALLEANDSVYRALIDRLQVRPIDDRANSVNVVERAAKLACTFHTGRFADGSLEQVTRSLGETLGRETIERKKGSRAAGRRRVLHVTTAAEEIGGLTRMIDHWIRHDETSVHALALTSQGSFPIPAWLQAAVATSGGTIYSCESDWPALRKASWLRAVADQVADLVVLHHHPSDSVPSLAFAAAGGPPVAVLNHADHIFWLGSSIADTVINLRTAGALHTADRRFVRDNLVLPIPLSPPGTALSREEARRRLGIADDRLVLLSVARGLKYHPSGPYDFVATVGRILDRNPRAHLYAVGASTAEIGPFLRAPLHERMHFVGSVSDPSVYRAAADVYLETFPFGSQTSLLEAALAGLAVVPAYAPLFPLLVTNDDAINEFLPQLGCEEDYIDCAVRLLEDREERDSLGGKLRSALLVGHVGAGWAERVRALYRHTDRLRHEPREVAVTSCERTPADVSLSTWNVMAERDFGRAFDQIGLEHAVAVHAGQVARMFGEWSCARSYAGRSVRFAPTSTRSWRLLALALLGERARGLKVLVRR